MKLTNAGVLVVALVAGCGGDDGGGGGVIPDARPSDAGGDSQDLAGMWGYTSCASGHMKRILTATADSFSYVTDYYADTDTSCGQPYATLHVNEQILIGNEVPTAPGAHNINIQTTGTSLTATTSATVSGWNSASYCGYSDWTLNVAKDVTGLTCGDDSYWPVAHVLYDIYRIDNDRLYFGDPATGDGSTAGTRPTELATGYYSRL